jgi:uncharacterized protein (TIGR02611 family)
VKSVAVLIVGGSLTLAGIALLVLPGPGFVLVAAGLAILATRFTWAARPLKYAKEKAQVGIDEVGERRSRAVLAVVGAVALLVAGVLEIAGVDLPLVNLLTASLLILSGLGLLGTIVYARRQGGSRARQAERGADDRPTAGAARRPADQAGRPATEPASDASA